MKNISYALGMTMAGNFLKSGIKDLDVDAFAKAMKSVYKKEATELSADEAREIIDAYFNKMQAEADSVNKQAGADYLEKNKKREGVHTTASGLQYEILQEGKGDKPKATDTVRCHYEGRLLDGRVFDSSYQRNKPADFPVNQVIPGWVEALQLMPVGSKWKLFIPSNLAYGAQGAGQQIGPHTTLVFEVELIDIV